ncbi:hypothetical protein FQZ97_1026420 [compost metagenome]
MPAPAMMVTVTPVASLWPRRSRKSKAGAPLQASPMRLPVRKPKVTPATTSSGPHGHFGQRASRCPVMRSRPPSMNSQLAVPIANE